MAGLQQTYKFKAKDAMAPRLSISWDPNGDGKNKIYAFYGKYFEKVPLDLAVRSLSTEVGVSRSDFYNINSGYNSLTNPIQNGTSIRDARPDTVNGWGVAGSTSSLHFVGSQGFLTPVLPGTKLPYTNEYVLGWDMQPSEGLTISNRVIYRSLGRALEDMGIDGGNNLPYYIANPGENSAPIGQLAAAIDPTLGNSVTPTATWPKPKRDYWAFEIELSKTTKHINGFFNLRLSRLEGNYEGLFRNDNGQSDPNITSLFDFSSEYLKKYEDPLNPDYHPRGLTGDEAFASGPLPNDRTVVANAGVTYSWDFGFSLTTLVKFQTGTPLNKFYGLIDYDNTGELAAGGRGSQGRTPNTLNFDLSGQFRLEARQQASGFFPCGCLQSVECPQADLLRSELRSFGGRSQPELHERPELPDFPSHPPGREVPVLVSTHDCKRIGPFGARFFCLRLPTQEGWSSLYRPPGTSLQIQRGSLSRRR